MQRSEHTPARVLITGSAGFIGYHLSRALAEAGAAVTGVDCLVDTGDLAIKAERVRRLAELSRYSGHHHVSIADAVGFTRIVERAAPDVIVHLAARAGVRAALETPHPYVETNLVGTFNALEAARLVRPRHLLMASSSSIYGAGSALPFSEGDKADLPVSLYAATKKGGENLAHAYAHLHGLPTTMLRFFTVYGPLGRADMAYYSFAKAIAEGRTIRLFNHGNQTRDFTAVDDIVEGIRRLIARPPVAGEESPVAPYRVLNIGSSDRVRLRDFVAEIERAMRRPAVLELEEAQPGDMTDTWADTGRLKALTGFEPRITIREGIPAFVDWFCAFHGITRPDEPLEAAQ